MIRIVVTTCPAYQFLLQGFIERFVKFWGGPMHIDIAQEREPWSNQILRICNSIEDDYIIRLCEDFYLQETVDIQRLENFVLLAKSTNASRMSLQCIDDGYRECSEVYENSDEKLFTLKNDAQYLCSLEASLYKRNFLLRNLEPGLNIWEAEIRMSDKARGEHPLVLVPEKPVVIYKDATRRGELRI